MRRTIRGFLFGLTLTAAVPFASGAQPVLPRRPLPPAAQARVRAEIRREVRREIRQEQRQAMGRRQAFMRGAVAGQMMGRPGMGMGRSPAFGRAAGVGPRQQLMRDRMIARRAVVQDRIRSLTPEQRQQLRATRDAFRTERQRVVEQVRTGSITREQARQQLQNWRREHRPNVGLRGPRPNGDGN